VLRSSSPWSLSCLPVQSRATTCAISIMFGRRVRRLSGTLLSPSLTKADGRSNDRRAVVRVTETPLLSGCCQVVVTRPYHQRTTARFEVQIWLRTRDSNPEPCG
jgi:hypothetical protein